jgi:hypothetical protein
VNYLYLKVEASEADFAARNDKGVHREDKEDK